MIGDEAVAVLRRRRSSFFLPRLVTCGRCSRCGVVSGAAWRPMLGAVTAPAAWPLEVASLTEPGLACLGVYPVIRMYLVYRRGPRQGIRDVPRLSPEARREP